MVSRWKNRRRRIARMLLAKSGTGPVDPEEPNGGNGDGDGDGNGGNGNGNGDGDWETPTPEVPEEELPDPPPGLWPAPSVVNPVVRLTSEQEQILPAGGVWPLPTDGPIPGRFAVLCKVPRHGWHYVIVDPDSIKLPEPAPLRK